MSDTRCQRQGRFVEIAVAGERAKAFVPTPLPPNPPLDLSRSMRTYERAVAAVGRLDGLTSILPSPESILRMYVLKEALLSSQIEGFRLNLADLLVLEAEGEAGSELPDDVREVSNYVKAVSHGLERLRDGMPLSLRLIRETHRILLESRRGASKLPGKFRTSQNWIGGTRPGNAHFVPPPPDKMVECLDAFERFLHDDSPAYPPLLRVGLAHVQFEAIHPFLDGNGRVGRLLIALMLCEAGLLREPVLYLSLFLKSCRDDYYRLLGEVRRDDAWNAWLDFFLNGVADTAEQAVGTARSLMEVLDRDRERVATQCGRAPNVLRALELFASRPVMSISTVARVLDVAFPTASSAVERLARLGIVRERTGRRRNRIYSYDECFDILVEGTEPLPV